MATPEPRLRGGVKRAIAMDNEIGKAYMRDNVVMRVVDCVALAHPTAHILYQNMVSSGTVFGYSHHSVSDLSRMFALPLNESRVLWGLILSDMSEHPNCRCVIDTDPAKA